MPINILVFRGFFSFVNVLLHVDLYKFLTSRVAPEFHLYYIKENTQKKDNIRKRDQLILFHGQRSLSGYYFFSTSERSQVFLRLLYKFSGPTQIITM